MNETSAFLANYDTRWEGKTVCFLGDSITDGVGVRKGERYFDLLGEKMKFRAVGYGVNGAQFGELLSQAQRMEAELGDDVDAIFLFAGTNDFYASRPLGSWYTETNDTVVTLRHEDGSPRHEEVRRLRAFCFDNSFCGSVNRVLSYLKHRYARKQIVLMTPIHRAYATFGPQNIQYPELYANRDGIFFEEYCARVEEAAKIWSTEFIDLRQCSGLFPLYDESAAAYFSNIVTDRLHPSAEGHRRMAEVICRKMTGIPLF